VVAVAAHCGGADALLAAARPAKEVNPERLGSSAELDGYPGYAKGKGTFTPAQGKHPARLPFVVEAWAQPAEHPGAVVGGNRTPVTADVEVERQTNPPADYAVFGCGLRHRFEVGQRRDFSFRVNVQCPHLPITSDGKAPDLVPMRSALLGRAEQGRGALPKGGAPARTPRQGPHSEGGHPRGLARGDRAGQRRGRLALQLAATLLRGAARLP
jgi:hypothetical protein